MNYNITLTEAEDAALSFVAASQEEWINNAVHQRCSAAINEILTIALDKSLETETPLPTSKEEIVMLAFQKGWIKTAHQRNQETQPIS